MAARSAGTSAACTAHHAAQWPTPALSVPDAANVHPS